MATVFAAYEEINADRGQLDFEDLLLLTAGAIENDRAVAGEIRGQYRHFTVDEYQDVNPLQQRLLDAWLGDGDDLCVVGDPNQTIYSFTGASPSFLRDFGKRYPVATVVHLVRDYRSTTQVVTLANRVVAGSRLRAQGGEGPEPSFDSYDDEPAEGVGVAARIAGLQRSGVPLAEMAVLFRVNAQSEVYEAALTEARDPVRAPGRPAVLRPGRGARGGTEPAGATKSPSDSDDAADAAGAGDRHPRRSRVLDRAAGRRGRGAGTMGVAARDRGARRGAGGRRPGRRPGRLRRGARGTRRRAARAARRRA